MYDNLFLNNNQYLTNDITGLERDKCIDLCIFIIFSSEFIMNGQGWGTLSFEVHGPIYSLQSTESNHSLQNCLKMTGFVFH